MNVERSLGTIGGFTARLGGWVDTSTLKPDALAALVSALAPADPRKTDAGKNGPKTKVVVPRDADGKPKQWVPGMATCRCGVGGGKHLFKDCPRKKGKEEKKALAAQAAADAAAVKAAAEAAAAGSTDDQQLREALAALLTGMGYSPGASPVGSVQGE